MRLKIPGESAFLEEVRRHEPDGDRYRSVLSASGRLLYDGLSLLTRTWECLPRLKVRLRREGEDLRTDLARLLQRHVARDGELVSFMCRCGGWYVEVRLLKAVRKDTRTAAPEWDEFLAGMKEALMPDPDGAPPDRRKLADAILALGETMAEGFDTVNGRLSGLETGQADMRTDVSGLKKGQHQLETGLADLRTDVSELKRGQHQLETGLADLRTDVSELKKGQVKLQKGQRRLEDGIGVLRGDVAVRATRERMYLVARKHGLRAVKALSGDEKQAILMALVPPADADVEQSFFNADLLMLCQGDDGSQEYLAVEASYRLGRKDAARAMRNAELLTIGAGKAARAVVAGVTADRHVLARVEAAEVSWYRLMEGDLQPD